MDLKLFCVEAVEKKLLYVNPDKKPKVSITDSELMSININFDIESGRNAGLLTPKVTRNPGSIKIIENCTLCIVVLFYYVYYSKLLSIQYHCQALGTMCIVVWVVL